MALEAVAVQRPGGGAGEVVAEGGRRLRVLRLGTGPGRVGRGGAAELAERATAQDDAHGEGEEDGHERDDVVSVGDHEKGPCTLRTRGTVTTSVWTRSETADWSESRHSAPTGVTEIAAASATRPASMTR